jgi:pyruvate, orthophosphate dikinase
VSSALDSICEAVESVSGDDNASQRAGVVNSISTDMVIEALHGDHVFRDGLLVVRGLGVSPGSAVGRVVRSLDAAIEYCDAGEEIVLVRPQTAPQDEPVMRIAVAIVTEKGGQASHAAVLARDLGIPAVCGTGIITIVEGTLVSVDGRNGEVRLVDNAWREEEPDKPSFSELPESLNVLLKWADNVVDGRLTVLANADSATAAGLARRFGARGIGLCRTEHMFLGDRSKLVRLFLSGDASSLSQMIDHQRSEIAGVLMAMEGLPVSIRLLDAPFGEFADEVEQDPMLGLRGVRLGVVHPELIRSQAKAIGLAIADCIASGVEARASIMVPLVSVRAELELAAKWIEEGLMQASQESGHPIQLPIGVMVETPRAALCADQLAAAAAYFSFGTNDLTQLVFGWGRDDLEGRLLPSYRDAGILQTSPFETLDEDGVARMIEIALRLGRSENPALSASICGEHGGDPRSVAMALRLGVNSVSCSAYRVPVARLAAAHAVIRAGKGSSTSET